MNCLRPLIFFTKKLQRNKNYSDNNRNTVNWLMGQVHKQAIGNVEMNKLSEEIEKISAE